jgi:protein-tyrosine kinase
LSIEFPDIAEHDTRVVTSTGRDIAGDGDVPKYWFSEDIAVLHDQGGLQSESIGALRTHLLAQHVRDRRRSLAICAPTLGVGSTYIAVNLACAVALAGVKTLLIDANMRTPGVDALITPSQSGPGLKQCLSEATPPLGDAIHDDVLPNLSVLFAGGAVANAPELLAGANFKALIDTCIRDFDLTIIDTPPGNVGADARRIAAVARYALIVARRDVTFVSDVKLLSKDIENDRGNVIGTFLNDF